MFIKFSCGVYVMLFYYNIISIISIIRNKPKRYLLYPVGTIFQPNTHCSSLILALIEH